MPQLANSHLWAQRPNGNQFDVKECTQRARIHRLAKVGKKDAFLCNSVSGNIKKNVPKKGCFAHRCKPLSGMPATLPCRSCAFNTRCTDKYFIFFLQSGNNGGRGRRKRKYKPKKNFVVTELSIQQCLAEFLNLEFCKNALQQNRIWKYKDLYSYEKPIEWPSCLRPLLWHLKASWEREKNNKIIIYSQRGGAKTWVQ